MRIFINKFLFIFISILFISTPIFGMEYPLDSTQTENQSLHFNVNTKHNFNTTTFNTSLLSKITSIGTFTINNNNFGGFIVSVYSENNGKLISDDTLNPHEIEYEFITNQAGGILGTGLQINPVVDLAVIDAPDNNSTLIIERVEDNSSSYLPTLDFLCELKIKTKDLPIVADTYKDILIIQYTDIL